MPHEAAVVLIETSGGIAESETYGNVVDAPAADPDWDGTEFFDDGTFDDYDDALEDMP